MRRYLTLAIVFQLIIFGSKAQLVNVDSEITYIRTQYKAVNELCKKITPISLDADNESTEGGELLGYKGEEAIIKIQSTYYGETGKLVTEYYYNEASLFFVFSSSFDYNVPIYDTESFDLSKSVIIENRYYFKDAKLIKWLDREKKEVSSALFKDKQADINKESSLVLSRFN